MGDLPRWPISLEEAKTSAQSGQVLAVMNTDSFTPAEFHIHRDGTFKEVPLGKDGPFEGDPEDSQISLEEVFEWLDARDKDVGPGNGLS